MAYKETEYPMQLHCKVSEEMYDQLRAFAEFKATNNGHSNMSYWVRKWITEGLERDWVK